MFHKAFELNFLEGTELEVMFRSGEVKRYDMARLFQKYPQMEALKDRTLFLKGRLVGWSGIVWTDELDIEVETIYEDGVTVRMEPAPFSWIGDALYEARAKAGMSQVELAAATGITQADISRIEKGVSNPSVKTLSRLADALGRKLIIEFV